MVDSFFLNILESQSLIQKIKELRFLYAALQQKAVLVDHHLIIKIRSLIASLKKRYLSKKQQKHQIFFYNLWKKDVLSRLSAQLLQYQAQRDLERRKKQQPLFSWSNIILWVSSTYERAHKSLAQLLSTSYKKYLSIRAFFDEAAIYYAAKKARLKELQQQRSAPKRLEPPYQPFESPVSYTSIMIFRAPLELLSSDNLSKPTHDNHHLSESPKRFSTMITNNARPILQSENSVSNNHVPLIFSPVVSNIFSHNQKPAIKAL